MTDIIAEPASTANVIPQGMAYNPILDWSPLLGVPLWVIITIVVIVAGPILVNVYFFRKVSRLNGIKGWLESLQKMTQGDVQVWVISRVQRLTIDCMQIKDNVISMKNWENIEMWYHNSPMARIIVGGNPGLVVSEDYHITRDFISEIALTQNCDMVNEDIETLKDCGSDNPPEAIIDYETYDTRGRSYLFHKYPNGLLYDAYNIFNPTRFRKYFPLGDSATHLGGDVIEESKDFRIRRKDPGWIEKYLIFGTCMLFALVIVIAAWFVPLKV